MILDADIRLDVYSHLSLSNLTCSMFQFSCYRDVSISKFSVKNWFIQICPILFHTMYKLLSYSFLYNFLSRLYFQQWYCSKLIYNSILKYFISFHILKIFMQASRQTSCRQAAPTLPSPQRLDPVSYKTHSATKLIHRL